jgi:hypothetical protein
MCIKPRITIQCVLNPQGGIMDVLMLISSEAEELQMLSEARVGERQAALEAR